MCDGSAFTGCISHADGDFPEKWFPVKLLPSVRLQTMLSLQHIAYTHITCTYTRHFWPRLAHFHLLLLSLHTQEAAGVFAALRDGPALHVEAPRPIDISPECAAMLERLCLAQAQEAIFDKARADKKNPATLARWVPLGVFL